MSARDDAIRALRLLDLTDLAEDASEASLEALCARAVMPAGPVAAICIWPQFVVRARRILGANGIRIATVVNFPDGGTDVVDVCAATDAALSAGADEIDLVMPWKAFLAGDRTPARDTIEQVRELCGEMPTLKIILETGEYPDLESVRQASELAIEAGADFIKTSTGKTGRSATPEAVRVMLKVLARKNPGREYPVGIKPSGGIRTLADAQLYLGLADEIMGPDWAKRETFRFGASGLHQVLLDVIAGEAGAPASGPY